MANYNKYLFALCNQYLAHLHHIRAERRRKKLAAFMEWLSFTLIFFFLYDIIWILADWKDFKQSVSEQYIDLYVDFVLCGVFALTSRFITNMMANVFLGERKTHKTLVAICAGVLILNMLIASGCEQILSIILPIFQTEDIWGTSYLLGLITSLVSLIHLSIHFSDKVILQSKENIELQKKYLKMQMNPHFVFNSLSALAGMIELNPRMAEDYVVKLSHIYRYILQHIDKNYIPIRKGKEFVEAYVNLLNLRYDGNVVLNSEGLQGENNEYILSLSLQLLIENAVKHNTPYEGNVLRIDISRQDNMFVIKNNLIQQTNKDYIVASTGMGISNLKRRYKLECGEEPQFIVNDDSFEVRLPIIKKNID